MEAFWPFCDGVWVAVMEKRLVDEGMFVVHKSPSYMMGIGYTYRRIDPYVGSGDSYKEVMIFLHQHKSEQNI